MHLNVLFYALLVSFSTSLSYSFLIVESLFNSESFSIYSNKDLSTSTGKFNLCILLIITFSD